MRKAYNVLVGKSEGKNQHTGVEGRVILTHLSKEYGFAPFAQNMG